MQFVFKNSLGKGFRIVILVLFAFSLGVQLPLSAQVPGGPKPGAPNPAQMNIGHFYGRVVDENGKGVAYASVQLTGNRFDTVSKSMKPGIISGQMTESNGDFSLEGIPVMGEFTLKVSFMGYGTIEQKVSFGMPAGGRNQQGNGRDMSAAAAKFDKDLGNIVIVSDAQLLDEVTIRSSAATVSLALDKKVYRVDKDVIAAGGTAEDALKNVPSLAVDIDGNLTLRNAAPQLFVDGRPTTLSLDMIPTDAIETVEVITNPSARYDASGGQAGIVNIVLKKDRRIGYNGSTRTGIDSRARVSAGADINAREGKVNVFLSGNFNQRKNIGQGETDRQNLFGIPQTNVLQTSSNNNEGLFASGRLGLDWFMSNRNTLTFAGSLHGGSFMSNDVIDIYTDSLEGGNITGSSFSQRTSMPERNFRNTGAQILFKHLYPKEGKEWTADISYNSSRSKGTGSFSTFYPSLNITNMERQENEGGNDFITAQTDFVNPLTDRIRLEWGGRGALRKYESNNSNFVFDPLLDTYVVRPNFADKYNFNDYVFALYGNFSHQFTKWGYQLGLRGESSQYQGNLSAVDSTFSNSFPVSLFPSVFVTYKLNENDNLQLSYSRRISRPNFFQLLPFTDFSDSLNLQRGNPTLIPEFTNSLEMSYQNIFSKGHNLLISVYYKQATNLITRYLFSEFDETLGREVIVSSYANSNQSQAYGAEFTLRNTFFEKLELTTNVNVYNSIVDASNIESSLRNELLSYFIKENMTIRLPAAFSIQLTGEYQSPTAFTPSGGGGGGRFGGGGGGGGGWGGPTNTAQGYTKAYWVMDIGIRKDLWKRTASISLNVQDIFRTRRTGAYTESEFFIQDTWRVRDPQVARLNFSYRFGKMDVSLFKRKNTGGGGEGMDTMQ